MTRRILAIGLASFAVLFFEISITRILSVVLWYHWAFLAVSLAMLALGAPGVWFQLRPPSERVLIGSLIAAGLLIPAGLIAIFRLSHLFGAYSVLFCMVCMLLPLLALGAAVCILLLASPGRAIGPVYAADLIGASLAALLVVPAMDRVATPQLVASLGFLPLVAALVLSPRSVRVVLPAAALVLAPLLFEAPLHLRYAKAYDEQDLGPIYERWTPMARLTFFDKLPFEGYRPLPAHVLPAFAWGTTRRLAPPGIAQYWVEQDANAGTPIMGFDGDLQKLEFLLYDVTSVGYQVDPPRSVAIIGAGGGRDILTARLAGADRIDAVEMNPHLVDLVSTRFAHISGRVYQLPGVSTHVSEGRSYLTRTRRSYDLIQISLIDSWAATAAGAFTLSENNLYTIEAYQLYWSRLSDRGMVTTSRWMLGESSLELPRLVELQRATLVALGVEDPGAHLAVLQGSRVGTVLMSKRPFDAQLLARLDRVCKERGFAIHYPLRPGSQASDVVTRLMHEGPASLGLTGVDLSAPIDDRPFFFQTVPILSWLDQATARKHSVNAEAVYALQTLVGVLVLGTLALFFVPFAFGRWMPAREELWRGTGYFAAIGLAFMWVEVPWLQRFILYLGHPSYASPAVLGSMLLGAGLGSAASGRVGVSALARYGVAVPVLLIAVDLALPGLFAATLGLDFPARVAIAAAVVSPVGFALGTFFPLGMLRFGDVNKAWFWAVNGAAGVLASAVSLAGAMAFGFSRVAWAGVLAYALAVWLIRGAGHEPVETGTSEETGTA